MLIRRANIFEIATKTEHYEQIRLEAVITKHILGRSWLLCSYIINVTMMCLQ
jgi:hypothetical protein